ncbi:hypothetical protein M2323_002940 [Rhodoblastus acidophilus]|uniref:hypothetical protein n=1 Tax=Rhodoblastus acidophilus TaxID=1074 RepID=UPI002224C8B2|nr:hypothetical protein [Rhodoblastus acidophilus]MCW2285140.1 hypothetical protein [Rhodoblastus acidophilus]MCW2334002.1 hypothetical protein [Rhodoblastus acidophilus]
MTDEYPETLALWRCIGCGAMGNAAECAGSCAFAKSFVVEAARYADLLEHFDALRARVEALRSWALDLCATEGFSALAGLRSGAKTLLAPVAAPPLFAGDEEGAEIWRCATCGQVEAFRDCLGVCIRRSGAFVETSDCALLADEIARLEAERRGLAALARQVAWSSPKPGQGEAMRLAFRREAARLVVV